MLLMRGRADAGALHAHWPTGKDQESAEFSHLL